MSRVRRVGCIKLTHFAVSLRRTGRSELMHERTFTSEQFREPGGSTKASNRVGKLPLLCGYVRFFLARASLMRTCASKPHGRRRSDDSMDWHFVLCREPRSGSGITSSSSDFAALSKWIRAWEGATEARINVRVAHVGDFHLRGCAQR